MNNVGNLVAELLNAPRETEWPFDGGVWKLSDDGEAFMLYLRQKWDAGVDDDGMSYEAGYGEPYEMYDIDIDDCRTCAGLVDSIFQIHNKQWITDDNMRALLRAVQYVIHPQGTLVSFGVDITEQEERYEQGPLPAEAAAQTTPVGE